MTFKEWKSFETNLNACRHITTSRGGLGALGFQGFSASVINWSETRWANHASLHSPVDPENPPQPLQYPSHPFPSILCTSISILPPGLQDLSFTTNLSLDLIYHLSTIQNWSSKCKRQVFHSKDPQNWSLNSWYHIELQTIQGLASFLSNPNLRPLERLLTIGCMAFVLASGYINDPRVAAWRIPRGIKEHLDPQPDADSSNTPHDFKSLTLTSLYEEAFLIPGSWDTLLWIAFAIAGTEDGPIALPNQTLLLDTMVRHWTSSSVMVSKASTPKSTSDEPSKAPPWSTISSRLQRFFWRSDLDFRWKTCYQAALERVADDGDSSPTPGHRALVCSG